MYTHTHTLCTLHILCSLIYFTAILCGLIIILVLNIKKLMFSLIKLPMVT